MKTKGRGQWRVASGEKERRQPHTPRCVCVNAVDKGVSGRFGVKAVDKGLMTLSDCGNRFSGRGKGRTRRGHWSAEPCLEIAASVAAFKSHRRLSFAEQCTAWGTRAQLVGGTVEV